MKSSSAKKIVFIIIVVLILLVCTKSFAFYTEEVLGNLEYSEDYKKWENIPDDEKQNYVIPRKYDINTNTSTNPRATGFKSSLMNVNLMLANLPEYDLREIMTVRNQGTTGQCWAITINNVLESNIEKTTGEKSPLFSSRYIEYATSKTFLDGTNPIGYNREVGMGGFPEIALGLYTSGNGPVLEDKFPFENNENKIELRKIQNVEVQKQVKDYVRFPGIYKTYNGKKVTYKDGSGTVLTANQVTQIRNMIKEHIVKYGAVSSQTCGSGNITGAARKYYNNPNQIMKSTAYFCNNTSLTADHQITIIGWDDNYAVTNFNQNYRPSTPGAYVVLNSWGENFGENGIYYISYEDYFIEKDILGIVLAEDIDFDNIYQYDELGNNYIATASISVYGANVFERKDAQKEEFLTQISLSSLVNTTCDIYVNVNNGELKLNNFQKVFSNVTVKDGYTTFKLDNPLELKGQKFAVMVKYYMDQSNKSYLPLEYKDNYYWNTATAQSGQSYISIDGNDWDDVFELGKTTRIPANSNLCIKAFTTYEKEYFVIDKYKPEGNYVYGVAPKTKLSELTNNISTNMEYYVYDGNKKIVDTEQIISTGMKIENGKETYKIIVQGDTNGDGKLSITDVVNVNLHVVGISKLKDEFEKAADATGDGKVTISDLVLINLVSVNLRNL